MALTVDFYPYTELTFDAAYSIMHLAVLSWPSQQNEKPIEQLADELLKKEHPTHPEKPAGFALVSDNGEALARAEVFPRKIKLEDKELTIMALAGVCSHPDKRGGGYGKTVVKHVFGFVDRNIYPAALFQTTKNVQPFYENLGTATIQNRIIDSLSEEPNKCPFWDDVVMAYSPHFDWPEGTIDLLGPGY